MARPTNKTELLNAARIGFASLTDLLDSMTSDELSASFSFATQGKKEAHWKRDKTIRDVLIHLHEWHLLLLTWIEANLAGHERPFLPAPYTWKTYGDMNVELWNKHQQTPLSTALTLVHDSHETVLSVLEGLSDDELFTKKHFSWTGSTTLGSYCISTTSAHYEWALKKLRLHHKTWVASSPRST